jgi:hypothetical protein
LLSKRFGVTIMFATPVSSSGSGTETLGGAGTLAHYHTTPATFNRRPFPDLLKSIARKDPLSIQFRRAGGKPSDCRPIVRPVP